jgi:hypothetical protein
MSSAWRPFSLETELAKVIATRSLMFGGLERGKWNQVRIVFGRGADFFFVDVVVQPDKALYPTVDALENALYDVAVHKIDEHLSERT